MHLISPEELASAIADRLARQPAVLVALDGRCGSGKTTLSAQLAERFPQSITVHTDDFYPAIPACHGLGEHSLRQHGHPAPAG